MATLKCVGCAELRRVELDIKGKKGVFYHCEGKFPYITTIGGLMRPGRGIARAADSCGEDLPRHCILCMSEDVHAYFHKLVYMCRAHGIAWHDWLEAHPVRQQSIVSTESVIKAAWIEVFREFVEDARQQGGKL